MLIFERHATTLSKAAYLPEEPTFWELDLILLYNKVLPRWTSVLMFTAGWVSSKTVQKRKQQNAWFLNKKT